MPFRLKLHSSVDKVWLHSQSFEEPSCNMDTWLMVGCFQGVDMLRKIGSKAFGSQTRQTVMWLTFEALDTVRLLVFSCSWNSRNTCSSSSGVLALLVHHVSCIPLTNEPVSLTRRCKRSKVFRFGKR
ncbi:hypothetical protein TNIN_16481 [Trichonephila inaurata madagascariensis]|uniref:Uncharacterized protein n=1 Tax=Trichonephila inaurata madagascariensis TaxID=2747483 RepID=A0A8X6XBM3_9ARAC|nr:hypothetical protein TNIN_16481 [Trichonephila inaurata madagascariensis]